MIFDRNIVQKNYEGQDRRVGFEFESSDLTLQEMADTLQETFGGHIEEESEFSFKLVDTEWGKFSIESDSNFLKQGKFEGAVSKVPFPGLLKEGLIGTSRFVVPNEIVTPPLPLDDLPKLEQLRTSLYKRISGKPMMQRMPSVAPCGMHINPEVTDRSPEYVLSILRAFAALQHDLIEKRRVFLLRRLWPYIAPYPDGYCQLLHNPFYQPDMKRLIDDYLRFNPTRNRALDLLPLFAWLDEPTFRSYDIADAKLVRKRPTFHYRLPNCDLANPEWSIADEWNSWAVIEKLAADKDRLGRFMHEPKNHDLGRELL